jgi:hypothetical protein
MMTIYFKNGMTKEISIGLAKIIIMRQLEGTSKFQSFSNENNEVFLILNLKEIVCIF